MSRFWALALVLIHMGGLGCAPQSTSGARAGPKLELTEVTPRVFSAIGATAAPSYENWGHNNNLSFVVGRDGVLVVNGGDSYLLARSIHDEVSQVTDVPVRWVVNENGQGHAFLGNSYWKEQGVSIIAHVDARHEIEQRGKAVLDAMRSRARERAERTRVVVPDRVFDDRFEIDLGDQEARLLRFGDAHSPGDISVWLPEESVLIAGDIAFHERLLGVFPDTDVLAWIESFEKMRGLQPRTIIPGHGRPTDIAQITKFTQGYLTYLVGEVRRILESDGDLADAYAIDQSAYTHLDTFDQLAVKNAGRVYQQLELEFF